MKKIAYPLALVLTFAAPALAKNSSPAKSRLPTAIEDVNDRLSRVECFASAASLLQRWHVSREWVSRPADMDGGAHFASPTNKVGVWVELAIYPNNTVEAIRISPDATVSLSWDKPNCTPRARTTPREGSEAANSFNDEELSKLLTAKKNALLYIWSPHMPISVITLPDAERIAHDMKLEFIPLLDPGSAEGAARALLREGKVKPEALRRVHSIDLVYRNGLMHFPTTFAVIDGKVGPVYPGQWEKAEYLEKFIREQF